MYKYVTSEIIYNKLVKMVKNRSLPIVDVSLKLIDPIQIHFVVHTNNNFYKASKKTLYSTVSILLILTRNNFRIRITLIPSPLPSLLRWPGLLMSCSMKYYVQEKLPAIFSIITYNQSML